MDCIDCVCVCPASTLQGRVQLLEDERLAATAQLAAKREEALSLQRDLDKQRDFTASLDAKLLQRETEAAAFKESLMQLEVGLLALSNQVGSFSKVALC